MFKSISWSVITLLLASLSFADDYVITGEAYDVNDTDKLLYRERYTAVGDDGRASVHYYSPDEERIAEKTLNYKYGETKPAYTLKDSRNELLWAVEWDGDDQLVLKKGAQDDPETERVSVEKVQVIDAGFDNFIQQKWESLLEGEHATFHFAFPNRLTNVRLRAERIDRDDSPIVREASSWVYFKIQVNSRILSLFADDLYLAYAPEEKQLMAFRGRSNLPDADGEGIDVEIHYEYHD